MEQFLKNRDQIIKIYIKNKLSAQKTFDEAHRKFRNLNLEFDLFKALIEVVHAAEEKYRAASIELDAQKKVLNSQATSIRAFEEDKAKLQKKLTSSERSRYKITASYKTLVSTLKKTRGLPHSISKLLSSLSPLDGLERPAYLAGWTVQFSAGVYRAFRFAKPKTIGVHLGKSVDPKAALKKIRAKEAELGLPPLKIKKTDLAFGLTSGKHK